MIGPMYRAFLPAIALAILCAVPARGQGVTATADTTLVREAFDEYENRFRYTVLLDPFALYSRTYGFGISGHVTGYNLLWPGSRFRLMARPQQRRGIYALTLRTHDPATTDVYGLFRTTFETNGAYRYYGVGQSSAFDNLIFFDKDLIDVAARVGFEFLEDHLTIQPMVGYLWNKASKDEPLDSAFVRMDRRSQEALLYALGVPITEDGRAEDTHYGYRAGLELALDYRDRGAYPTGGFLVRGAWNRYQSLSDLDVIYDRFDASAHGFIRVVGSHVLALRAWVQSTADRGEDPIPLYLVPKLDFHKLGGYRNQRHIDLDLVNVSAEYRWPLINLVDLYQVSMYAQAGLGGVYEDVWNDFELGVTFERDLVPGTNALRPGFGLGIRVSGLEQQIDYIDWMLGVGPEGFTLYAFRFVVEIGDTRWPSHD